VLLALQLAAYSLFTYFPPPMPLFEETRSGLYGIPPETTSLDEHR
jgi:hypothetical protein